MNPPSLPPAHEVPRGTLRGFVRYWKSDMLSGFLVFLIALPLCLGISMASGYPPIAGIMTAVIGGIVTIFISDSELTIKGPAAGLIVICIAAVTELGQGDLAAGYRLALGVGVVAGVAQIFMGMFRIGILGEFFPTATVHGMLAAIGIIIASKQIHVLLGVTPEATDTLGLIGEIPHSIAHANPELASIGIISAAILFLLPRAKFSWVRKFPAPMLVLLIAIPMGLYFGLEREHTYALFRHDYAVGPRYLVNVPHDILSAIVFPDFSAVGTPAGIKYVAMFAIVGSLESLLSAKAIDLLDPLQRKTSMNRDLTAIGVGNTLAGFVGGLPMISEIVRSSANIGNGARTRFANMWHGVFLLSLVWLVPALICEIPLAALAAMLVYTGYRLASPREFVSTYRIGREQLVIFTVTLITTLATDLLIGIGTGIVVKCIVHLANGVPLRALFWPKTSVVAVVEPSRGVYRLAVCDAAVFSNWLGFQRQLLDLERSGEVILDLSGAQLIDHTVMTKLDEIKRDFEQRGHRLDVIGLETLTTRSAHPHAARKRATS